MGAAATLLGVSYRRPSGCGGGSSGAARRRCGIGRWAGRRIVAAAAATRQRVLALIRQKYSGDGATRFGPTLVAEHLASEDGLTVDHETLRRWMLAAGLWSRARQRSPYRQRRERKAHFGELVQLDGSFHRWYEDRGPARCLITMVDDATSRRRRRGSATRKRSGRRSAVLRRWIEQYGVPLALYTDWKNVYVGAPTDGGAGAGVVPLTQFGRMCAALQIQIIPASSPQAKGRVERQSRHPSRSPGEETAAAWHRRRRGGECVSRDGYWPSTMRASRSAPAVGRGFPSPLSLSARVLDRIFRLEETRTVGHDWVVRYHNRLLQVERQAGVCRRGTQSRCANGATASSPFVIASARWPGARSFPASKTRGRRRRRGPARRHRSPRGSADHGRVPIIPGGKGYMDNMRGGIYPISGKPSAIERGAAACTTCRRGCKVFTERTFLTSEHRGHF